MNTLKKMAKNNRDIIKITAENIDTKKNQGSKATKHIQLKTAKPKTVRVFKYLPTTTNDSAKH